MAEEEHEVISNIFHVCERISIDKGFERKLDNTDFLHAYLFYLNLGNKFKTMEAYTSQSRPDIFKVLWFDTFGKRSVI